MFPSVTTIEFDSPDYTVIEDNGTVTVCLTTNRGIAIALDVEVVASFKPSSSNPACKACMYVHVHVSSEPSQCIIHCLHVADRYLLGCYTWFIV